MDEKCNATICSNCKYFQRYYVLGCSRTFKPTQLGRCVNTDIAQSLSTKHIRKDDGCDLWQPYELQKLNIQYSLELRLQTIGNDVADILAVLRDVK